MSIQYSAGDIISTTSAEMEERAQRAFEGVINAWEKDDIQSLKQHTRSARRSLWGNSPPLPFARESGVVRILFEIIKRYRDVDHEIVHDALWAISNVAGGTSEDTLYVVDLGILPILRTLLDHPSQKIVEQTVWCMGNISGEGPKFRDLVLDLGICKHLEAFLVGEDQMLDMQKTSAFLLANLCMNIPRLDRVMPVVDIAMKYVQEEYSRERVLVDMIRILENITESKDGIDAILDSGVTFHICAILLDNDRRGTLELAKNGGLQVLGNICRGDQLQIQTALDHGMLMVLNRYASSISANIHFECYKALRVLAVSRSDLVFNDEQLIAALSSLASPDSPSDEEMKQQANLVLEEFRESITTNSASTTGPSSMADGRFHFVQRGLCDSWSKGDFISLKKQMTFVRRLFSVKSPSITPVRETGMLPILIDIMAKYKESDQKILEDCAMALAKILGRTNEDIRYMVDLGVLPILRNLLDNSSSTVAKQAFICLSIITCANDEFRDRVFGLNLNPYIERYLIAKDRSLLDVQIYVAEMLVAFCKGASDLNFVVPLLKALATFVERRNVQFTLHDLLLGIFAKLSRSIETIDAVLESGIISYCCSRLQFDWFSHPLFETLINLCRFADKNKKQMKITMVQDVLKTLKVVLKSQSPPTLDVVKDTCEALEIISRDNLDWIIDDKLFLYTVSKLPFPNSVYSTDNRLTLLSFMVMLCERCTDIEAVNLANVSFFVHAFFLGRFHKDHNIQDLAWRGMKHMFKKARVCATVKTFRRKKYRDKKIFEDHWVFMSPEEAKDEINVAAEWFVVLRPLLETKTKPRRNFYPQCALWLSDQSGLRLNQICTMISLLGPSYSRRLVPLNGIWLTRDIWILFSEYYYSKDFMDAGSEPLAWSEILNSN